jgi:hypothetical protein
MNLNRNLPRNPLIGGLLLAFGISLSTTTARANVYASDVRINGGITNISAAAGDTIAISYLLNEPASGGVTVQIRSGGTVARSLTFAPGSVGTLRGFNEVTWDGRGNGGQNLASGTYSVSVTAAASGYTNWTQITSDTTDPNTYVYDGRGIAADRNPTSPYYGRIFVGNSFQGPGTTPGDTVGILKLNADTSAAEEGISSSDLDGYPWAGDDVSPWKIEVSADDFVYVGDLSHGGEVLRFDPTISSNSFLSVLRTDNQTPGSALSGPALFGSGTGTQVWMADTNSSNLTKWGLTSTGVCVSNDTGQVVVSGTGSNFFDVALDKNGNIYTCANISVSGDPSPRVFRYRAYDPAGSGVPETTPDWAVGGGNDTYAGANGIAVDPTGTYVAVAFRGPGGTYSTNGNTKILWATNGALVANLDLGVVMQGDNLHDDTDCAWDAVGNVYYIDAYFSRWRAFSPPGTNQSISVALAGILLTGGTVGPGTAPQITRISVTSGLVNIDFSAGTNDDASAFVVQAAATVGGPYILVSTAAITKVGPGLFHAQFAAGPSTQYFRIVNQGGTPPPPSPPVFTKISIAGGNVVLTFTGNAADSASAFSILAATSVNGSYSAVTAAQISLVSSGVFQAILPPANGLTQFYRVRR